MPDTEPRRLLKLGLATSESEAPTLTAVGGSAARGSGLRLEAGATFGPYRIERLLGRGGMGEVYAVEDLEQHRRVALKVLSSAMGSSADRERFLSEGRLAASVSHPHTVYVFGSRDIDGMPVIAMELVDGGTLKDRVEREGPLPVRAAVDAMLHVIAGLQAAEAAGILHRDIKPSNCFVDADGRVKVGDFGLSISTMARLDHLTLVERGEVVGTPAFAAPEQLRGEPLDVRSDIYAAGATLHYLLIGRAPFEGDDLVGLIARVVSEPPQSLRRERPDIPQPLSATILRCLDKDRTLRPGSYAALAAALEPFGSRAPVPAPPGLRFLAGAIDLTAVSIIAGVLTMLAGPLPVPGAPFSAPRFLMSAATLFVYFGVPEGLWQASIGKALTGLRVVDRSRVHPGVLASSLRAALFEVPQWIVAAAAPQFPVRAVRAHPNPFYSSAVLGLAMLGYVALRLIPFVTARRRNGFAGFHELWSGTRTVRASSLNRDLAEVTAARRIDSELRLGPYVVEAAGDPAAPRTVVGFDPVLRRNVWIRIDPEHRLLTSSRRDLRRPPRLRWLDGGAGWNAFEAPGGEAIDMGAGDRPWRVVSGFLPALAEELVDSEGDGTRPAVVHLWLDEHRCVRLLDWEPPGVDPRAGLPLGQGLDAAQHVLAMATQLSMRQGMGAPPPLKAVRLSEQLSAGSFPDAGSLRAAVASACRGPVEISRRSRATQLAMMVGPAAILLTIYVSTRRYGAVAGGFDPTPVVFSALMALNWAYLALLLAAVTRGGLGLRLIGGAIVTGGGRQATWFRALSRAMVAVSPLLISGGIATWTAFGPPHASHALEAIAIVLGFAAFLTGAAYAAVRPARGWHDALAGTWVVPR